MVAGNQAGLISATENSGRPPSEPHKLRSLVSVGVIKIVKFTRRWPVCRFLCCRCGKNHCCIHWFSPAIDDRFHARCGVAVASSNVTTKRYYSAVAPIPAPSFVAVQQPNQLSFELVAWRGCALLTTELAPSRVRLSPIFSALAPIFACWGFCVPRAFAYSSALRPYCHKRRARGTLP